MLVYMNQVIGLDSFRCGIVLTISRFVDCIGVLVVGYVVDRFAPFSRVINGQKFWHLVGCTLKCIFMFLYFHTPPGYDPDNVDQNAAFSYYMFIGIIGPLAFSTAQIPHMTMANSLAKTEADNVALQAIKNGMNKVTFIIMYLAATFLLKMNKSSTGTQLISWADNRTFTLLSSGGSALVFIGTVTFHILVKSSDLTTTNQEKKVGFSYGLSWFRRPAFYTLLVFYSFTWALLVIILTYQPFYLQVTLGLNKEFVGVLPLVSLDLGERIMISNF